MSRQCARSLAGVPRAKGRASLPSRSCHRRYIFGDESAPTSSAAHAASSRGAAASPAASGRQPRARPPPPQPPPSLLSMHGAHVRMAAARERPGAAPPSRDAFDDDAWRTLWAPRGEKFFSLGDDEPSSSGGPVSR